MVVTGRNKRLEELYHLNAERSEFYHMADLMKPPTLFTPDDHEKVEISSHVFSIEARISIQTVQLIEFIFLHRLGLQWNFRVSMVKIMRGNRTSFHIARLLDFILCRYLMQFWYRKEFLDTHTNLIGAPAIAASGNIATLYASPAAKRRKLTPPPCERVMIYVRQENELAFTPLHLVPPTSLGLIDAVSC